MQTFHSYFKRLSKSEREAFAEAVDTSVAYLWQIIYEQRRCKEGLAIEISKASNGEVPLSDLRPDVDWDYVRRAAESITNSEAPSDAVDRGAASDDMQVTGGTPDRKAKPKGGRGRGKTKEAPASARV
jgi:DNA-binding transcriptional regulator YdaS (Cro superfamily)